MPLQGNEIFKIQKAIYDRLDGWVVKLSNENRTAIAVALDAAVLFGTLRGNAGIDKQKLEKMFFEKMERLGADKIENGSLFR